MLIRISKPTIAEKRKVVESSSRSHTDRWRERFSIFGFKVPEKLEIKIKFEFFYKNKKLNHFDLEILLSNYSRPTGFMVAWKLNE